MLIVFSNSECWKPPSIGTVVINWWLFQRRLVMWGIFSNPQRDRSTVHVWNHRDTYWSLIKFLEFVYENVTNIFWGQIEYWLISTRNYPKSIPNVTLRKWSAGEHGILPSHAIKSCNTLKCHWALNYTVLDTNVSLHFPSWKMIHVFYYPYQKLTLQETLELTMCLLPRMVT